MLMPVTVQSFCLADILYTGRLMVNSDKKVADQYRPQVKM